MHARTALNRVLACFALPATVTIGLCRECDERVHKFTQAGNLWQRLPGSAQRCSWPSGWQKGQSKGRLDLRQTLIGGVHSFEPVLPP
jgi:hypothetical protein